MPGYGLPSSAEATGLLPWSWAAERLSDAHNYFLATTRPNGAPHVMPIWGVWFRESFYFSTGDQSRKAHNLKQNPRCVVCPERAENAVMLEGVAEVVRDNAVLAEIAQVYDDKYHYPTKITELPGSAIYKVLPRVVFGISENAGMQTWTRWVFGQEEN
jgi:general stress protein 26